MIHADAGSLDDLPYLMKVVGELGDGSFGRVVLVQQNGAPDKLHAVKISKEGSLSVGVPRHASHLLYGSFAEYHCFERAAPCCSVLEVKGHGSLVLKVDTAGASAEVVESLEWLAAADTAAAERAAEEAFRGGATREKADDTPLDEHYTGDFKCLYISYPVIVSQVAFMSAADYMRLHRHGCGKDLAAQHGLSLFEGITRLHMVGVVHRDLKLENLLFVGADNQQPDADQVLSKHKVLPAGPLRLVIGDAGSGSWAGLIEPPKGAVCTYISMAPEMAAGNYNQLADVWGGGATLLDFRMGTRARNMTCAQMVALLSGQPVWNVTLDEDERSLFTKCLCAAEQRASAFQLLQEPLLVKARNRLAGML